MRLDRITIHGIEADEGTVRPRKSTSKHILLSFLLSVKRCWLGSKFLTWLFIRTSSLLWSISAIKIACSGFWDGMAESRPIYWALWLHKWIHHRFLSNSKYLIFWLNRRGMFWEGLGGGQNLIVYSADVFGFGLHILLILSLLSCHTSLINTSFRIQSVFV